MDLEVTLFDFVLELGLAVLELLGLLKKVLFLADELVKLFLLSLFEALQLCLESLVVGFELALGVGETVEILGKLESIRLGLADFVMHLIAKLDVLLALGDHFMKARMSRSLTL